MYGIAKQDAVTLTENNVRNLIKNKPIQLKHAQLLNGQHTINFHPLNQKKISQALSKGKGLRLTLTQPEINEGEGFKDLWNKVKAGAKWIGTQAGKVIDSNIYQTDIKPITRKAVNAVVAMAEAQLPAAAKPLIDSGVQKLSEVTNAFGVEDKTTKKRASKGSATIRKVKQSKTSKKAVKPKKCSLTGIDRGASIYLN